MATDIANRAGQPRGLFVIPPALRQLLMLAALAGAVALGVMAAFWAQTPNYGLLYGNLSDKDTGSVLEGLTKANIPYKIDDASGAILVPAKQVHEARLKLATQGLPHGTGVGFEIMDDKPTFGNTQFQETARYQRAIEGELARSIMTISNIQTARVHLAIPHQSAFVRDRDQPSASVLINLYSGRTLESDQVSAIVHLVAASVPNLSPTRVTVIDQKGRLLTASEDSGDLTRIPNQLEYRQKLEGSYVQRIEEILTPIAGEGAVKAQVTADLDFTVAESAQEKYNPQGQVVRSEQTAEEMNSGGAIAGGVPGALSNQPPGGASVPELAVPATPKPAAGAKANAASVSPTPAPTPPMNSSKRATRNYEMDKTISHVRQPTGTIKRLSAAVVVDDIVTVDKKGRVKRTPRSADEIARLTALAKEAVGFDEKRGDTLNVTSAAFSTPGPAAPIAEPPFWKQEWFWDVARQVGGGLLGLVLLLVVVRPLLRGLQTRPASAVPAGGMSEDRLSLGGPVGHAQLSGPGGYEQQVTNARTAVQQDPKKVAQVVKNWVGSDG